MKRITLSCVIVLFALLSNAQPPEGKALPGDSYGEKITTTDAINISEIPAKLEEKKKFDTKIKAKVLDVCPKMGCWLKLAVNDSTTAFVKMKDYAFFAPTAIKGKTIILEGEAELKTTSVDELRHYAEDAKKSKEEIASIKEPKKEIRFMAKGITVVE